MAKRRSSSSKFVIRSLLIFVVILIFVGIFFGEDAAIGLLEETFGIDLPGGPGEDNVLLPDDEVVETTGGSGSFYSVYFTEPIDPWDESKAKGGVEEHLIELINNAQSSIDAAMFEFNLQNVADALIAAHNRGVTVRIVYDDEHTEEDPQIEALIDAGIPAVPDERSALMHNKFYVFDRHLVWTGSMNITVNGVYRNNNNAIAIRSSQVAENYTREFEEMFAGEFGPTSPANTPNPVIRLDGVRIETYFSPEDDVMPHLIDVVKQAKSSIHFMAFSFTDDDLMNAIIERANAGVSVSGIFESRGANTEYSACPPLLDAGLDVRLDGNPRTFHHKVFIIDESIVAIGSFNFSNNAATSNDENMVIVYDAGLAQQYVNEFNRRVQEALSPVGGECLSE